MKASSIVALAASGFVFVSAGNLAVNEIGPMASTNVFPTHLSSSPFQGSKNHFVVRGRRHTKSKNWREGLRLLKYHSQNSPVEVFAIYADSTDSWRTIESQSGAARVEVSGSNVAQTIVGFAERTTDQSQLVRICIAHTHPYLTMIKFLQDPEKRSGVFDSDHRPYRTRLEKLDEHPKLTDTVEFALLDIEEQHLRYSTTSKYLLESKIKWTTLINLQDWALDELLAAEEYRHLRFSYASFTTGTKLRFTDQPDTEPPVRARSSTVVRKLRSVPNLCDRVDRNTGVFSSCQLEVQQAAIRA